MSAPDLSGKPILVPVSIGELFDKLTILRIKEERIVVPDKLAHVRRELAALHSVTQTLAMPAGAAALIAGLQEVNRRLWDIEDAIRGCERAQDFGARFIALARDVYRINDQRAHLKLQINQLCGSVLQEEKSYAAY